ncbi:hypothetical protein DICVIV_11644 [Dictyocaulus viviparus]|uniref:Saposin B-type domain-containing protein n=1 Tax=Dictyocaulus viviparus TaxID=29172 RepID=A0A0D8XF42_DICVI|nr:hypothetical protein DICVIV_11644 [Dictyocaulus viviparus]
MMFLWINLLSLFAANVVFAGHPVIEASTKRCLDCYKLLSEAKSAIQEATVFTEEVVESAVKAVCGRFPYLLEEVCDFFEKKVFEALFKWIEEKERKWDVENGCEHIRLCPRSKTTKQHFNFS